MVKLLLALLCSPVFAQEGSIQIDHFLGLDDTKLPATLNNFQSQDLLNTESNIDGSSLKKRSGYTLQATLTYSTSAVTGSHVFFDGSGNQLTIVCHDKICSKSTNGGAFSNFLSTAAAGVTRWQFVDINGNLYGVNDQRDKPFQYTGSAFTSPATMPQGTLIELTKDRAAIAGTSANPNRVSFSQSGTYTNFTTGPLSSDPWTEDFGTPGDKITAIKYALDQFLVFKRSSITGCLLGDQYTTKCYPISNVIGTNDPASVVIAPDGIYFRAQDRTFWKLNTSGLTLISREISNLIASQTNGQVFSNIQYRQSDWQAGYQSPSSSWDTATIPGSIFPSSVTFTDQSSTSFNAGTLSNISIQDSLNKLTLSSTTFRYDFNGVQNIDSPVWTLTNGSFQLNTNQWSCATVGCSAYAASTVSSGTFKLSSVNVQTPGQTIDWDFMSQGTGHDSNGYDLQVNGSNQVSLLKWVTGVSSTLCTGSFNSSTNDWYVIRDQYGNFTVSTGTASAQKICSATDTTYSTSVNQVINPSRNALIFGSFYSFGYPLSGTFTSKIFNTGFSNPTAGPFSSTYTFTFSGAGAVFYVRNSSSPNNDLWTAFAASSDTLRTNLNKQYQQYQAVLWTAVSTQTPSVSAVGLAAVTTGYFNTQCINTTGMSNAYGVMSCDQQLMGAGLITYASTSTASCTTIPWTSSGTWTNVTNNTAPTISTGAATWLRFASLMGSTTDQAQVNSCTLYWNNGNVPGPVWGIYDSIRNALYWTTSINNSTTTNRTLKYDLNLDQWYPFDLPFVAPKIINSNFYAGSANGGYWYQFGPDGTTYSDNGAAINAYWKSKDFFGASPFQDTEWRRVFIVPKNQNAGTITSTWTDSFGQTGNYSISTSTGSTLPYVRSGYNIQKTSPAPFINLKFSNSTINQKFEIGAVRIDYFTNPYIIRNP